MGSYQLSRKFHAGLSAGGREHTCLNHLSGDKTEWSHQTEK